MHCSDAWGLRFGDRRGSGGGGEVGGLGRKGKAKERDHACLAILVFCARDHGEPLIVEHWSSGKKKRAPLLLPLMRHCCLGKFISSVIHREGTLDAGAPQEFALLTQGRN